MPPLNRCASTSLRLTMDEFDERMNAVLQAKTRADLDSQFFDLPGGAPANQIVPHPDEQSRRRVITEHRVRKPGSRDVLRLGGITAIWVLFAVGCSSTAWWLFWIPLIIDDAGKKN